MYKYMYKNENWKAMCYKKYRLFFQITHCE